MFKNYNQNGTGYELSSSKKDGTVSVPVLTQKERKERLEKIKTLIKK